MDDRRRDDDEREQQHECEDRARTWLRSLPDARREQRDDDLDAAAHRRRQQARAARDRVARLVSEHLTERQREIVELIFFRGLDQPTVAQLLGISQQSVSEHLYGKRRGEERIGGIIPKLRKLCAREAEHDATRMSSHVADGTEATSGSA